jgi:hypothetical protein
LFVPRAAGHLLEKVVFLVGALGRNQDPDGIRSMFLLNLFQTFHNDIQGLVPGGLLKFSILLDERLSEPVRAVHIVKSESAFNTGPAPVHTQILVRGDLEYLVILNIQN